MRRAKIERSTKETTIKAAVDLDGTGAARVATGIGFLDHMLEQLSRHSLIDLQVKAKGDLHIDFHHTTEDTGIAIGEAVAKALGDRTGIRRWGEATVPMDETLTRVALDLSGRPFLVFRTAFHTAKIGSFDTQLVREFFTALMDVCKASSIAVWDDEIQSFGRTESMFAYDALNLGEYVDVFCVGKMTQVCATLYTEEYNPGPGLLSGTFTSSGPAFHIGTSVIERLRDGNWYGKSGAFANPCASLSVPPGPALLMTTGAYMV